MEKRCRGNLSAACGLAQDGGPICGAGCQPACGEAATGKKLWPNTPVPTAHSTILPGFAVERVAASPQAGWQPAPRIETPFSELMNLRIGQMWVWV